MRDVDRESRGVPAHEVHKVQHRFLHENRMMSKAAAP